MEKHNEATREIVAILDGLFSVEELIAIHGLIEKAPAEMLTILTKAAKVSRPGAPPTSENRAAFQQELTICGVGSDLVECSPERGVGLE